MADIEALVKKARDKRLRNELTWTTKEGETLLVDEMSDSHVRNAFKLLLRRVKEHDFNNQILRASSMIDEDLSGGPFFWKDEG